MSRRSALTAFTGVLTNHNDLGRSGANLNETVLSTTNVKTGFGFLQSLPVSGQIYGQPLYVAGAINGLNALFVVTEENKVYAFNADPPWQALWPGGFRQLESAWVPASFSCSNSVKPFGINSTPVIDPGSNPPSTAVMYVVTKTLVSGSSPKQFLHALSLTDGSDRPLSPLDLSTASTSGSLTMDPLMQQNRVALTLSNKVLSIGFGSYCDHDPYKGWVLRVDTSNAPYTLTAGMRALPPFVTTPNTSRGSVWMGGTGFSGDGTGALYFTTGNGPPTGTDTSGTSLGNAFVKLTGSTMTGPTIASWFMPSDVATQDMQSVDTDVGSSGPLLIPGTSLIVGGGKNGIFYLLRRDDMGHFVSGPLPEKPPQVEQRFAANAGQWIVGSPVWWEGPGGGPWMYVWPGNTPVQQYKFDRTLGSNGGLFVTTPAHVSGAAVPTGGDKQGGFLSLSANGTTAGTGILWATHASEGAGDGQAHPGVLYAFDASDVSNKLWDSTGKAADKLPSFAKYNPPTIAGGHVYVATFSNAVVVYGLTSGADAGVNPADAADAPVVPPLTCDTVVDPGPAQPTTWSYVYTNYFAQATPPTVGHCGNCHGGAALGGFLAGTTKDTFYQGLVNVGQITPANGAASPFGNPATSPLYWFGQRSSTLSLMPRDQSAPFQNARAIAAICGWIRAGAINDQANGTACTANNQCTSTFCADGFCCDGACTAACKACAAAKTGGTNGTCASMTAGTSDTRCGSSPPCGNTGLCAAGGACAVAATSVNCRPASCASGLATAAANCNGAGACPAVVTTNCTPFICGGTACKTSCAVDTDCIAGDFCSAGVCVPKKANGAACAATNECTSSFCADGFCCNSACNTACKACAGTKTGGSNGTCASMTTGAMDTRCGSSPPCGNTGACAAGGVCAVAASTVSCRSAGCASGVATAAANCNGAGVCPAAVTASCAPFICGATACTTSCTTAANCAAGAQCTGGVCVGCTGGVCKANGAACMAGGECTSGFCADGFCCNSACNTACKACSAARTGGANGTCASTTTGVADSRCGSAPPCGNTGLCAAGGVCAVAATTVSCRPASCSVGLATAAANCNGAGACPSAVTTSCSPFICGGNACKTTCTVDTDCIAADFCSAGTCVPRKANGAACAATSQCTSGFCVDGFCCNSVCAGACSACAATRTGGANGTCAPLITGATDTRCGSSPPCGNTGACAAGGVCAVAATTVACGAASCSNGVATAVSHCNGTGACAPPVTMSCSPFVCSGTTACKTTCAVDTDCITGDFCSGTTCVPKKGLGATCAAARECGSNSCSSDGVCCSGACALSCQGCTLANTGVATGTCGVRTTPAGNAVCNNACVNKLTDPANCGGCGIACAAGATCSNGACSTPACTTANAIIDDFEDNNNVVAALEGRTGQDYSYADTTGTTITPAAGSIFPPATPGNGSSARAAHISGTLAGGSSVYAGFGADMLTPKALYNASKYTGISFFAKKGSSTASSAVRVKVPDRNTDPVGAICTSCFNDFGVDLSLTTTWTKYTIPFSSMTQLAGWGAPRPAHVDPTGVAAVQFQVTAPGAAYDIWIDDLTFTCN